MLALQILIDGFAISALYALGATGFTLIFGVSGVLNLSHGAIMVLAAVAAWAAASVLHLDIYSGALVGVVVALISALITYFAVVQPIQKSRRIPNEEKEIFVLTGTLLWGIMIQELIAYFFTNNAKTVLPIVGGVVDILGVRTPSNEIFTALVCCLVIGLLWLLVNRTRTGKAVLAASMNPRGVTLLGLELTSIYVVVWAIYGILAGIAGVLLAVMLWKFAPETLWLLPGLWQILVSLGMFASVRSLPRTVAFAGAWYFIAGFVVLVIASHGHALSPWTMGLPFVIGQLLMATIIHFASGESDAEE